MTDHPQWIKDAAEEIIVKAMGNKFVDASPAMDAHVQQCIARVADIIARHHATATARKWPECLDDDSRCAVVIDGDAHYFGDEILARDFLGRCDGKIYRRTADGWEEVK